MMLKILCCSLFLFMMLQYSVPSATNFGDMASHPLAKLRKARYLEGASVALSNVATKKRILLLHISNNNYIGDFKTKASDPSVAFNSAAEPPSIAQLSQVSALTYARIHGYTYRRLMYDPISTIGKNLTLTWLKVYGLLDAMHSDNFQHEWIVVMDFDVVFMDYIHSLEDKIREWSGNSNPQILWPDDPARNPVNYLNTSNGKRILNGNSGFQIWKNTAENMKIVKEWLSCPKSYCSEFSTISFHEQSAFNKYFRLNLSDGVYQSIPCDQANGFPDFFENDWVGWDQRNEGCFGRFVSHFWCESKHRVSSRQKIYQLMNDAVFAAEIKLLESHRVSHTG